LVTFYSPCTCTPRLNSVPWDGGWPVRCRTAVQFLPPRHTYSHKSLILCWRDRCRIRLVNIMLSFIWTLRLNCVGQGSAHAGWPRLPPTGRHSWRKKII
jgi:hypothetical protein